MAEIYVRSTDGSDADNGTTWALAKYSIDSVDGAGSIDAAGDSIYLSASHAESSAAAVTFTGAGTFASPTKLLCVDDTGDPAPPTAPAATAVVETTGNNPIALSGVLFAYGITFRAGVGSVSSACSINLCTVQADWQRYVKCAFVLAGGTTGVPKINVGNNNSSVNNMACEWEQCDVKFNVSGHGIMLWRSKLIWRGGSILSGSVATSALLNVTANTPAVAIVEGVDMTNGGSTMNLVGGLSTNTVLHATFRSCTLPTSWTGELGNSFSTPAVRVEMYNCDPAASDTNYRSEAQDYAGKLTTDSALYRAPGLGASSWMYSGSTQIVGISYKMAATANAEHPAIGFRGLELAGLNATIDPTTSHVITCFFTSPGQADFTPLSNKDIGLVVQYPGTSGGQASKYVDDILLPLATEADQDADSAGDWDDALGAWGASTVYSVGVVVRPTTRNGKTYYCSVAGTSHTVEPTWLTTEGGETAEGAGTARWRCMHRQKMVVTLDASAGKVRERGWISMVPVMYLASAVAWVDPVVSITSS